MPVKITIVRNPATDAEFERAINQLVNEGIRDPELFQARLREGYAEAVVRPRELAGESALIWYVYREGHWVRTDD